jgi:uncharacterized protein (DUF305 family)
MRRSTIFGALAAAALAALVFGLPVSASAPAPNPATAAFEVDFMTQMIDHHAMAVEMADLCIDRATHPDLRVLCEGIASSQSQEIETMQSWLHDWYGVSHEPEMTPADMQELEMLASLAGADFEIEFMRSMIRHHEKAITEAEGCLDHASHDELLGLCADIIATQSAEVEQMQSWLCHWYGRCREHTS